MPPREGCPLPFDIGFLPLSVDPTPVDPSKWRWPAPFAPRALHSLHRYCEAVRPSPAHRYFRPRGFSRLCLFPWHRRPGSHVPYQSQIELRAAYMPDAAWAVSVHPPSSSRKMGQPPVLTSPNPLSTLLQRFACARLSRPCLPESCPGVPATLTTTAFDRSSSRWLGISDLIAEPEGPSFISCTVAHRRLDRRYS